MKIIEFPWKYVPFRYYKYTSTYEKALKTLSTKESDLYSEFVDNIRNLWLKRIKDRRAANMLTQKAMHKQHLNKGYIKYKPCEICGIKDACAHHDNYNYWFDIRFLCEKHHREYHQKIKKYKKALKVFYTSYNIDGEVSILCHIFFQSLGTL